MIFAQNIPIPQFCRCPLSGSVRFLGQNLSGDVSQVRELLKDFNAP